MANFSDPGYPPGVSGLSIFAGGTQVKLSRLNRFLISVFVLGISTGCMVLHFQLKDSRKMYLVFHVLGPCNLVKSQWGYLVKSQ